jgi:hypothetical protein
VISLETCEQQAPISVDEIDAFLVLVLEEGSWVPENKVPAWIDRENLRFTDTSTGTRFGAVVSDIVRCFDRNGLIDAALDLRRELELQSDTTSK